MKADRVLVGLVAGAALLAASGLALAKGARGTKKDVVMSAESMKWEEGPVKGTHVAKIKGDWMKGGPYQVLIKFDAGVMHGLHKHTQDLEIVVLSGTFVHKPEGGSETKLGPGSYLLQRGGMNHVSGCAAGADCTFYMMSREKFDMTMAEGAGSAAPAGK